MKRWSLMLAVVGLGMALTLGLAASPALALSLQGNYYTLSSGHIDTLGGVDGNTVTGLVLPALSGSPGTVGAAPVASGASAPASGGINDKNGANVIQWWTVHSTVTADNSVNGGVSNVRTDNFVGNVLGGPGFATGFFPNGNPNDANGFRAVHWTGTFLVGATPAHLTLSADDDAFLFLNGNLALDNGGVKAISLASTSTVNLTTPGTYIVDLFFADRHQIQSGIAFSCENCLDPVPEPATLLLLGTTLAGVGAVVRRRMKAGKEVA